MGIHNRRCGGLVGAVHSPRGPRQSRGFDAVMDRASVVQGSRCTRGRCPDER